MRERGVGGVPSHSRAVHGGISSCSACEHHLRESCFAFPGREEVVVVVVVVGGAAGALSAELRV